MTWIGWAILSAFFAAATALLAKVGVEHVDSNFATALRTTVVVLFAWGIALALGKHGEIRLLDRRTLLFLALSGMATGLSWLCYFRALQLGPASRVAPLDKLSVPLVMLFAWLLLGEKLNVAAVTGGLLITAGAVVMVLGRIKRIAPFYTDCRDSQQDREKLLLYAKPTPLAFRAKPHCANRLHGFGQIDCRPAA